MFIRLFENLRLEGIGVGLQEWLTLLAALKAGLAEHDGETLRVLARTILIKDERHYARFEQVYADWLAGADQALRKTLEAQVPDDWLRAALGRSLSDEEKAQLQSLGGLDQLLQTLRERLAEQRERHAGGNRWIGTGGTSPFGHGGYHPEGVRIGGRSGQRRAVKVIGEQDWRDLDDREELAPRHYQIALRALRRLARVGREEELDMDGTIAATARNAGSLDLRMRAERRNAVRVLLLLDIGGSMDEHVQQCEALFAAAQREFREMQALYFHNCIYERLWKENRRREASRVDTATLLRDHGPEWRIVIVGDASMGPYEITHPGGSVEHYNPEPGAVWLQRFAQRYPRLAWLNPLPPPNWEWSNSVQQVRELIGDRMFPLSLAGLKQAVSSLRA